ncbi:MAG: DEAD/DEAH box helicase [Desulfomicrobium apsheronum]|nr:DEAD/DEAH box helicase [Desulfomicrobium apsheronum]
MPTIRLTPSRRLALDLDEADATPAVQDLATRFAADWREGLFCLGARRDSMAHLGAARFWAGVAARYLTTVCHLSENQTIPQLPSHDELRAWVENAPPMPGGEYLRIDVLETIWSDLAAWGQEAMEEDGGIEHFLQSRAPGWNAVGRVTLHLAENPRDPGQPFAFMASFTTGLGPDGQVRHLPLRKALELHAGTRNKPALVKLLTPIQEAATRCDWVRVMVENGDIYRPMAWPTDRAYMLLRSIPSLEDSGLVVRVPDWWKKRPRPKVGVVIGESSRPLLGVQSMLDFRVNVTLDGAPLSPEDLKALLAGEDGLVLFKGTWVEVDRERLRQALEHWRTMEHEAGDGLSFIQGMRLLAGTSLDLRDQPVAEEELNWSDVVCGQALHEILHALRHPARLEKPLAAGIAATPRPYQHEGAAWLHFLSTLGLGACLADDMGLGKTLQVLTVLDHLREQGAGPSLLVLPASLLGNWRAEAERFAPGLRLLFAHPAETPRQDLDDLALNPARAMEGIDLVVTTYALVDRTQWMAEQSWNLVILDEAQAIKNHATKQSKAVRRLKASARIALTGTPVENRVGDLWSLFDFLNPGLLGTATQFKRFLKDTENSPNPLAPLRKLVAPYILRRLKTDKSIIADLPDKTETVRYCGLSRDQIKHYELVVRAMERALDKDAEPMARRGLVLQSLMRLKQICNHPAQFTGQGDFAPDQSGKFMRLAEIAQELAERQEKALVFTQFREIIPALHDHLNAIFGRPGLVLHGGTAITRRADLVREFQSETGPPFFVLSLKAGGTGLNLTAASHVIHFDRWWNPAVENQATDRCFRIGQHRNVLVHKFVTTGTIEEKIDLMIAGKKALAENLLGADEEIRLTELSDAELLNLVRLDLSRAVGQ